MKKNTKTLLIVLLVGLSIITWYISYRHGLVTIYNDAMGHLDVARAVVDGKQTGLAQLGSVWLPFNHILFLSLIWNNWAWHSGFAGSFFSMIAYILGTIGIYKIVDELTGNFLASVLGGIAFALNPNVLYLQTTPLTEPLYLVVFIFSVLYLIKFIKTDDLRYLLLAGLFGMLQALTRYDGWFAVIIEGLALIYQQRFIRKLSFQEILGKVFIFAAPIVFGIILWILWNTLIFGNPLYFIYGPESAHAQQTVIQNKDGLITKGNLGISILAYWYDVSSNIGNYLIILAGIGIIFFVTAKRKMTELINQMAIVGILFGPAVFNVIALYLGFSILNLPQLHWNPTSNVAQYFNVRNEIMALPLIAVFVGILAAKARKKIYLVLIFLVIVAQALLIYHQGIITVAEGTTGSNTVAYGQIANILAENVTSGENILISNSLYSAIIFRSGFPMERFITEGASSEWKEALANPENYADWIVMGNQNLNDAVYASVYENDPTEFLKYYKEVNCNPDVCVYEKKTPAEMFVYANGTSLDVNGASYAIKGVNDYDLAYKSDAQIDATFQNLNQIGVNTVRFWLFGDGNSSGFQTESGVMNEDRLESADYVIADAAKYHIRLIPVLLNNWTDYGGIQQYLKWVGKDPNDQDVFYTDPEAISLFENYINHVIPRKNTITGISYNNDPTILAWEVINEPRFSNSDSKSFINWFSTIASYIRQEDPNHMITLETDTTSFDQNGNPTIADYCAKLSVDFCTAHLYLYDSNNLPFYSTLKAVQSNINQYIKIADSDNKPFVLGEVGVPKNTSPFGEKPLSVLENILSYNKSSGALVWNWSDVSDTSYGFSPLGTNGIYNLKDLSTVLGGIAPAKIYTAPTNSNEGGYDVSTPEMELSETSASSVNILFPIATSTVISAATTPSIVLTPPVESNNSVSNSSSDSQPIIVDKSLPYSTNVFSANDWNDGWGSFSIASGTMIVGSSASTTSGAVFLSGSNTWTNYIFTAYVKWKKGYLFTLVGRRFDDSNFVECVFSNTSTAEIEEGMNIITDNKSVPIAQPEDFIDNAAHISYVGTEVSMEVRGNNVQCNMDNARIYGNINGNVLTQGGVGFEMWDPQPDNSEIIVGNVSVTPVAPPVL